MPETSRKNLDGFDLLKFVMSFFIVAIHTLGPYTPYPLVRIAVPVFFLISSYLFFGKLDGKQDLYFLKKFVVRNLTLYGFWFVVLSPIFLVQERYLQGNIFHNVLRLISHFFLGSTFAASWYIMALIIGTLPVFFLKRYLNSGVVLCLAGLVYAVCCFCSTYKNLFSETGLIASLDGMFPDTLPNSFPAAILWIAIGSKIAETKGKVSISKRALYGFTVLSFAGLIAEHILVTVLHWSAKNDCYFMLIPTSLLVFYIFLKSNIKCQHAKLLRNFSTLIYCMHMSIVSIFKKLFINAMTNDISYFICFFLVAVFSLLIAGVILFLEKKPGLRWLKYSH